MKDREMKDKGEKAVCKKHEGDRSVSFIDAEVMKWLEDNRESGGLCLGRFHADLVVSGLTGCVAGGVIEVAGLSYEIAKVGKRCFAECDLLTELGEPCPLAGGVAFGKRA